MSEQLLKWKVCGMKYADNIGLVAALEPDYLGFIFWNTSPRFLEGSIPEIPKHIKKTGVFVNASLDMVEQHIENYDLKVVQLHGKETPDTCRVLKMMGVEVIKAFALDGTFDFSTLKPYEGCCDFFLFDAKGKLQGGNGYVFDWTLLKGYTMNIPFFLSGGIGLEEILEIQKINDWGLPLYAIDVNSRFEEAPGLKNMERLKQFKNKLSACGIM